MIPDDQVRFLNGPLIILIGTRDRRLRPHMSWATAVRAEPREDVIAFVLPDAQSEPILADLADNGRIAMTVSEPKSHETYQFKGRFLDRRPAGPEERARHEIHVAKVVARLNEVHMPGHSFERFALWPGSLVRFRVEDIFIQTPGPDAGKRLQRQLVPA